MSSHVYIKFRSGTEKRWSFLTAGGGSNYLKIHAARIDTIEKAQTIIGDNAPDNPEFDWRIINHAGKVLFVRDRVA